MGFIKQALDASLRLLRRSVPPTVRAGRPSTAIFGGFINTIEKNRKLNDRERYRTFSEIMANVSIVGASVRYFLNLLARAGWKVETSDPDDPQAVEIAERISTALFEELATPWHRVVRRAAMARYYGFAWQEWTARRAEDGTIIFDDIEPRAQLTVERWDMDLETGKILGVVQRSPQTSREHYIPRAKSVYTVDDSLHDSPEGLGLFRHIVDAAERLLRYQQLEGFGYEKDLRGIPVARAPIRELALAVERGEVDEDEAKKQVDDIKRFIQMSAREPQTGLLLDSIPYQSEDEAATPSATRQWDMELLSGSNYAVREVALTIARLQREIARTLGTESILMGETGAGSLAMSRDKSDQLAQVVDSSLQDISQTFDKDVVEPLMRLNGWPMELQPKLRPDKIQQRDVLEIAQTLREMANAGALLEPGDPAIDEIRGLLGLSVAPIAEIEADLQIGDNSPPAKGSTESTDQQLEREGTEDQVEEKRYFVIQDGGARWGITDFSPRKESRYAALGKGDSAFTLSQRSREAAEAQARFAGARVLCKKVGSARGRSVYIELIAFESES